MSRCFPFPPPGYEKKARTDDVDVLKKEKQREKKHKKEKKDREKREKEKGAKDRSDGKHREKKDKKEKNRDKKKDKEKDTDKVKEKLGTSNETRIPGKTENHAAERLIHKDDRERLVHKDDRDKRDAGQVGSYHAEKLSQNSHLPVENRNSVLVELARRTKDEARGIGNQLVEKITGSDPRKDEGMVRLVAKGSDILAEVKENSKDKRVDVRKLDVQGVRDATQVSGVAMVQNPGGMVQPKVQGLPKPFESNVERKTDGKEKTKEKEGDEKRGEKRKDKDREKKNQGKDKDRDKEKKKEEKAKKKNASKNPEPDKEKKKEDKANEKNGSKHAEPDKSKESNKEVRIDSHHVKTSQLPKDSNKSADAEGNLKKRKDLKTNGVFHANDIRPNKLLRPSSSHPLTENGRTLEPCQTSIPYISDKQGGANSVKVDSKERKKNGIIEARSSSVSPTKPTSAATQADPVAEASMRPPHPDSRYLSEVYMVPKTDELSDYDDQDWLFGCSDTKSKKPKMESSGATETAQVWSEALRIESADIFALPYVIPY